MDLNGELNFDVDLNTLGDGSDLIQVDVPAGEEVASSTEEKGTQEIGKESS